MKILIIGCGPTALGAACQINEYIKEGRSDIELTIVERENEPGGLSRTVIDPQGYKWDYGGHVTFSNFEFYNRTLTACVPNWKTHQRICAIDMAHLNKGKLMLLPYPIQKSVIMFPEEVRRNCAKDLRALYDQQQGKNIDVVNGYHPDQPQMRHFDDFCRQKFGDTLTEVFFKPYNEKIWRTPMQGLSAEWISARVAPIDEKDLDRLENPEKYANEPQVDHGWGPNATFRYPIEGGTGYIWKCVHNTLPANWFRFNQSVTKIDINAKTAVIKHSDGREEEVRFDKLISTIPLDILGSMCGHSKAASLRHTSVVVTGIGVKNPLPEFLIGKSWLYFPDDSPFYRASVLSNYFPTSTPKSGEYTLLIEQSMIPEHSLEMDTKALQEATISALAQKGFLDKERVTHVYSFVLPYGYPIPTLDRTTILNELQSWLENHNVYSRGRFGGWKYECSNQDYSFMQGAEVVAKMLENKKENVYTL